MKRGVSIVIATYNRARLLRPTLESVGCLEVPSGTECEILVVDNNCTDETSGVVEEFAAASAIPVRRVVETAQGLSHARNRGLHDAACDNVIYFDDDVRVSPDWIAGYFEAVDKLSADCVVGPVSPFLERELPVYLTQYVLDLISSPYTQRGAALALLPTAVAHEIPGCNFALRKKVALDLGGFDPKVGRIKGGMLGGEDVDFGQRLVEAGGRVAYQPRCAIQHVISTDKMTKPYLRRRWYGMGTTKRIFDARGGVRFAFARKLRAAVHIARLAFGVPWLWLAGMRGQAFEQELKLLLAAGYFRDPGRRRRAEHDLMRNVEQ